MRGPFVRLRIGKVMSTQVMFGPALARERALGLGFWDDQAPPIDSIQVTVAGWQRCAT